MQQAVRTLHCAAIWILMAFGAAATLSAAEPTPVPTEWGGDDTEWGAVPADIAGCCDESCRDECACSLCNCRQRLYTPMLGDQGGFGTFTGFGGGFNIGGGGGFGGGGFNAGGGFNFGGGGNFGSGGFNIGGGGFNFGAGQFNAGGGFNFGGGFAPISVFRGAYKISENESPVPQDRAFIGYNYYHNVQKIADVHRETPGFEKTFWDGQASIGLRIPAIQVVSDSNGEDEGAFADLTVAFKFALLSDPDTGSVLTAGMAVTAPTGPNPTGFTVRDNGTIEEVHPTLLQPFLGFYWSRGDFFVHGFHSVMAPTDSDDVTVLFNDVGFGYWLESSAGFLRAVVPTLEVHMNTPLNHRDEGDFPRYRDSVNLTTGATFILGEQISMGSAIVVPVTGPRLFDVEALANLNFFY